MNYNRYVEREIFTIRYYESLEKKQTRIPECEGTNKPNMTVK